MVHTAAMVSLDANKADLIFETNVNGTRLVVGGAVAIGFLELIRNIPLLVLLYLFYYVLGPIFGFGSAVAASSR